MERKRLRAERKAAGISDEDDEDDEDSDEEDDGPAEAVESPDKKGADNENNDVPAEAGSPRAD